MLGQKPLSADMIRFQRARLLHFASRLTACPAEPLNVLRNAETLQAWMDAASGPDDARDRFAALDRADGNRPAKRAPDDMPQFLIAEAEDYYAFLRGGAAVSDRFNVGES